MSTVVAQQSSSLEEHWATLDREGRATLVWRLARWQRVRYQRYSLAEGPYEAIEERFRVELERDYRLERETVAWLKKLNQAVSVEDFCRKRFPDITMQDTNAVQYEPIGKYFHYWEIGMTEDRIGELPPELVATPVLILAQRSTGCCHGQLWGVVTRIGISSVIERIKACETARHQIMKDRDRFLHHGLGF